MYLGGYEMSDQQAALAIVATVVGSLIWIVKFLMSEFRYSIDGVKESLDKHVKAANNIAKATESNTVATQENAQVTRELQQFMFNLNGKLAKITSQKIQEQTVEHQTVNSKE